MKLLIHSQTVQCIIQISKIYKMNFAQCSQNLSWNENRMTCPTLPHESKVVWSSIREHIKEQAIISSIMNPRGLYVNFISWLAETVVHEQKRTCKRSNNPIDRVTTDSLENFQWYFNDISRPKFQICMMILHITNGKNNTSGDICPLHTA